jgi:DNA repair exonuclease SbcCD ATPase subunit
VTNGYGVKVPKSEIDKERESLLKEDKEYYDENPEDLEEDIENFIRSYRETMTVSDIQKLSEKTQPVEIKKSEEELQKSKTDKPEKEKSKLKDFLSSNPLQNLKEGGMKLAEKLKPNLEQLSDKGMNLAEKFKPKQEQLSDKGMESENSSSQNVSAKDIQALTERLKQGSKLDKETQTLKTGQKSSPTPAAATSENISATSPVEKNAGVKPDIQTTKPEKATQASSPSVMTDQDIKEIKGLLAGIYKSINGPLSIASDRPYRPNSNTF